MKILFIVYLIFWFFVPLNSDVLANNLPLLKIISPTDGQTVLGDKITISFVVGNLIVGSEGHLHLWLDNPIHEASNATEITTHFDYVIEGVSAGIHTITLEVVKPDHTSYDPAVAKTTYFTTQLPQNSTTVELEKPQNNLLIENIWPALGIISGILIIIIGFRIKKRVL